MSADQYPPLTPAEREAMERAWATRGIPADIEGSPWAVGAALWKEFEAGFKAALAYARESSTITDEMVRRATDVLKREMNNGGYGEGIDVRAMLEAALNGGKDD